MDEFVGVFLAFKGEDEYIPATNVLLEVTEATKSGEVEIALNAPLPGTPRVYIRFRLADLASHALALVGNEL